MKIWLVVQIFVDPYSDRIVKSPDSCAFKDFERAQEYASKLQKKFGKKGYSYKVEQLYLFE